MTIQYELKIPPEYIDLCNHWYSGQGDMMYAVASTGSLSLGSICPVYDYDDKADRDLKWYYTLCLDLSTSILHARRSAENALRRAEQRAHDLTDCDGEEKNERLNEYHELSDDYDLLVAFLDDIDSEIERLETENPQLENWSGE